MQNEEIEKKLVPEDDAPVEEQHPATEPAEALETPAVTPETPAGAGTPSVETPETSVETPGTPAEAPETSVETPDDLTKTSVFTPESAKEPEDADDVSMYYPDGDAEHIRADDAEEEDEPVFQKKKTEKSIKLTKGRIIAIVAIFLAYTLLMLGIGWYFFYKPDYTEEEVPFETDAPVSPETPPLDDKTTPEETEPPKTDDDQYRAESGVYNFLVIGHDGMAFLADVAMIVNLNTNDNTVSVMQIPRDTFVSTGVLTNKINAVFSTTYADAYNAGEENPSLVAAEEYAQLLEKSLCINIHHTIVMGLNGFNAIVDSVGGVDVYVQNALIYSDPEQGLVINIPAGYQHLDGYAAQGFVRFRNDYVQADLGRVNAQKIFMTALFTKVKSLVKSMDVSALTNLAKVVSEWVDTSMSFDEILAFAKLIVKVDLNNIHMTTLPGNTAWGYYVMNRKGTLDIVNTYFNIYNKEITDSIFDRYHTFCDPDDDEIMRVYDGDPSITITEVYDGEQIDDGELVIPFVGY